MPNQPNPESSPNPLTRNCPRAAACVCFDKPLITSNAGRLLPAEYAARSGDIARIADALAPKLKAPIPGGRRPQAREHWTRELLTQRVLQMIGGYLDDNDSKLLRHDPALPMLIGNATPGTPEATPASQPMLSRMDNGFSLQRLARSLALSY